MEEYSGKRTEDKISAIEIPEPISDALSAGASLAISISGGKDSQAMLYALERERKAQGWTGYIFAIHAHLGRMEWPQSLAHCERICADINVPLIIVRRPQGDLLQEMQERMVETARHRQAALSILREVATVPRTTKPTRLIRRSERTN